MLAFALVIVLPGDSVAVSAVCAPFGADARTIDGARQKVAASCDCGENRHTRGTAASAACSTTASRLRTASTATWCASSRVAADGSVVDAQPVDVVTLHRYATFAIAAEATSIVVACTDLVAPEE